MTPEQAARYVLSDCQDSELRALADREAKADLAEALLDPAFKAKLDANLRALADEIDRHIAEYIFGAVYSLEYLVMVAASRIRDGRH